jgi:hypothetical protein
LKKFARSWNCVVVSRGGLKAPLFAPLGDMLSHLHHYTTIRRRLLFDLVPSYVPTSQILLNVPEGVDVPVNLIRIELGGKSSIGNQRHALLDRSRANSGKTKESTGHSNQRQDGEVKFVGRHGGRILRLAGTKEKPDPKTGPHPLVVRIVSP